MGVVRVQRHCDTTIEMRFYLIFVRSFGQTLDTPQFVRLFEQIDYAELMVILIFVVHFSSQNKWLKSV